MEMAAFETQKFKRNAEVEVKSHLATNKFSVSNKECFRCGKTNHDAGSCYHKKSQCHSCKKFGHLGKNALKRQEEGLSLVLEIHKVKIERKLKKVNQKFSIWKQSVFK